MECRRGVFVILSEDIAVAHCWGESAAQARRTGGRGLRTGLVRIGGFRSSGVAHVFW